MDLPEDVKSKVKRQVEFYFSDSNLHRDAFLLEEVGKSEEGYVDIALLCSFSRMKGFLKHAATKVEDVPAMAVEAVAAVLRTSDLLTVDDEGKKVRRTTALGSKEDILKDIDARSLYADPFPYDVSLDDIQDFFAAQGPVNCVRMRRHMNSKDFKGSVFVEFTTVDAMREVLGRKLEFAGAELHLEPKSDYVLRKKEERKATKDNPHPPATPSSQENTFATANGSAPQRDEAHEEAQDEAQDNAQEEAQEEERATDAPVAPARDFSVAAGSHVRIVFPQDADLRQVTWQGISEVLGGRDAGVRRVHMEKDGDDNVIGAVARFSTCEEADEAIALAEGVIKVAAVEGTISKVPEEEEQKMRKELEERFRTSAQTKQLGRRGGRGGRGQYGRGRGRGRGQKRSRND